MQTFARQSKAARHAESAGAAPPARARLAHGLETLARPSATTEPVESVSAPAGRTPVGHDFGRISVHARELVSTPGLSVSEPGDRHEQEAERLAARVMNKPVPAAAETASAIPRTHADAPGRPDAGGGGPLPQEVRSFMEPRFGADLSHVRVHTGGDAARMSHELNASAFTHGRDIYFGEGHSPRNDLLTAHELAHVLQRGGRPGLISRQAKPAPAVDWREQARNKVPFGKWTLKQQEDADREWRAASRRIFTAGEKEKWEMRDNDNEVFKLLHPYRADLKDFFERHPVMQLYTSLTPAKKGASVTFTAEVRLPTGVAPAGDVTFDVVYGGGGMLTQLGRVALKGGKATLTTSSLPASTKWVKASFPASGKIFGAQADVRQEVN